MPEYYSKVPKTLHENLKFRRYMIAQGKSSKTKAKAIWHACKDDILFWCNAFVWTFDPRKPEVAIPFITYPFQDEGILSIQEHIHTGKQLVMQKVRDMGASWMSVLTMDHEATFEKARRFVMMSYTADLVDKKGNPKSLFWKLDFIHKWMPKFLEPPIETRILGREYLQSGSTLDGCTTTERSSVGDRATAIFIDEFSRFDANDARMVKSGLADVSPCRIWNFTPNPDMGRSHPSYELVDQVKKGHIDGLTMHWRQHPDKVKGLYRVDPKTYAVEIIDKEYPFPPDYKWQRDGKFEYHSIWFDAERLSRGNDQEVAQNMEIDWDQSSHTVFDPVMIRDYIFNYCKPPLLEGDLSYDEEGKPIEFTAFRGGPIKLWGTLDAHGRMAKVPHVAGVDVSFGRGSTNSVITAGRKDTGETVLEYATAFMEPIAFALKCIAICRWLGSSGNETKLCWERQGPGDQFGTEIVRLGYTCIYYNVNDTPVGGRISKTPGWVPKSGPNNSKAKLLGQYRSSLSKGQFINRSKMSMEETLEWNNTPDGPKHREHGNRKNDPSGAEINHGDRVISAALCDKMRRESGSSRFEDEKKEPQGCFAQLEREMAEQENKRETLYPNWRGKR